MPHKETKQITIDSYSKRAANENFPTLSSRAKLLIGIVVCIFIISMLFIFTEIIFSDGYTHHPTLMLATTSSVTLIAFGGRLLWRAHYAARFLASTLLFFSGVMLTQVNSELAATPTSAAHIKVPYFIFCACILIIGFLCISCYIFPDTLPNQKSDRCRKRRTIYYSDDYIAASRRGAGRTLPRGRDRDYYRS